MRRILSMLLLVVFGLPLFAPLMAHAEAREANLPACCRRNGSHHCMMMVQTGESTPTAPAFRSPRERCPYCPATVAASHSNSLAASTTSAFDVLPMRQSAPMAETQPKRLGVRRRSRTQRGPPSTLLLA